jgi:hypothetical protein
MAPGMMGRYPVMPMACERKRKMYELVYKKTLQVEKKTLQVIRSWMREGRVISRFIIIKSIGTLRYLPKRTRWRERMRARESEREGARERERERERKSERERERKSGKNLSTLHS